MGMEYRYLTAPWAGQDLLNAIREMATGPSIGWSYLSNGSKRGGFPGWQTLNDPGVTSQAFMAADKARNRFLYTTPGGQVYAIPVAGGAPSTSVLLLSGLPSGNFMPVVIGDRLYLGAYGATTFRIVPINPDGSLGTPVAPTASPPGNLTHLVGVQGRLFALVGSTQVYEARLSGGDVTAWTLAVDLAASGASSGGTPSLFTDGRYLYYLEPKSSGNGNVWRLPLTPSGIGTPQNLRPFPNNGGRNYPSAAPWGGDDGVILLPYVGGASSVYLLQLDTRGGIDALTSYSSATPGYQAAQGAGAMLGRLFVLKYGGTIYYAQVGEQNPGLVLHVEGDLGREKFLYLRYVVGSNTLEAYIAEDWDPTNDTTTNLSALTTASFNPGVDLIVTAVGMPTHLGLLFRQGASFPTPFLVCELDPHLRPDGSLLYPVDDGSWPLWGGVKSWGSQTSGVYGIVFHTLRGPLGPEWAVVGDVLSTTGYTPLGPVFFPAHPPTFGGPSPLVPYAKRGRLYQRANNTYSNPTNTETGLERGHLGAGDTILFAYDTGGAMGDTVELPTGRYLILMRKRDSYGYYDLLVQAEELVPM